MKPLRIILTVLTLASIGGGYYYVHWTNEQKDLNPPVLKPLEEEIHASIHATDDELRLFVTAEDPEEGDVSGNILIENIEMNESGDAFKITYAAFDSAGNASELTCDLYYDDYKKTHFGLIRPIQFTEGTDIDVLSCFTAEDELDGDLTPFITITGADRFLGSPTAGNYPCTVSVTNSVGDTATLPVNVEVEEAIFKGSSKPSIVLTDYIIYMDKGKYFEPLAYLGYIVDGGLYQIDYGEMVPEYDKNGKAVTDSNGNQVYQTQKVAEGSKERWVNISTISTSGSPDTSTEGVYTVEYSYDSEYSGYSCHATLIVVVE